MHSGIGAIQCCMYRFVLKHNCITNQIKIKWNGVVTSSMYRVPQKNRATLDLCIRSTSSFYSKAFPGFTPNKRRIFASGQNPVKADCNRFAPTKAVNQSQ